MKILDLYIARVIFAGTLLALSVLAALDLFFAIINEFEDVGKAAYTYIDALVYVGLTLPRRLYELFPPAVLVGSLLSLGALAGNSELVAMRAAGVSVKRIMRSAAQAGLVLLLLVAALGEFLVPTAESYAREIASRKEGVNLSHATDHGFWVRDGDYFVQVGKVYPDHRLENVYIYQYEQPDRLASSAYVESVLQQKDHWELRNVRRTRFEPGKVEYEVSEVEHWPTSLGPKMFDVLSVEPSVMSARDLFQYVEYLTRNKLDAATYRLAFWLKIMTPISCVVMLFIVLPFVFGPLRSVSAGQLLVVGILLGLGFYTLMQIASQVGQLYGIPPFISATFPVLCFTIVGLLGLARVR